MGCNGCKHLNINHDQAKLITKTIGRHIPHMCEKYNTKLLHVDMDCNTDDFYRCKECVYQEYLENVTEEFYSRK
jgi:hypothetical protein